ncbi:MAG TPA: hypothetical protein VFQ45_12555 [Longimicrobium sp.]|nr:hypothetical protein [Longimicrobium sp.]
MQPLRIAPSRLVFGAALLLASVPLAAQPVPTGREVVERYVEAVGGRQALARVQHRHAVYEMSVDGRVMTMDVKMARPNHGLVTLTTPMGPLVSGFDGTIAWVNSAMTGAQLLEGPEAEQAMRRARFDGDVLFDAYTRLETLGREEIDGQPCWNVRMSSEDGEEATRCFHTETGLQVGATENGIRVVYGGYLEVDGLKYPASMTSVMDGERVTITLKRVSHDPIPAETFALPAEVRALLH